MADYEPRNESDYVPGGLNLERASREPQESLKIQPLSLSLSLCISFSLSLSLFLAQVRT